MEPIQDVRPAKEWKDMFSFDMNKHKAHVKMSAFDILSQANYGVGGADMAKTYAMENSLLDDGFTTEVAGVFDRVKTEALYERPVALQRAEMEDTRRDEECELPEDLDYHCQTLNLSAEERQKLAEARPANLHAASRIPGVTPAAIVTLLRHAKRKVAEKRATSEA